MMQLYLDYSSGLSSGALLDACRALGFSSAARQPAPSPFNPAQAGEFLSGHGFSAAYLGQAGQVFSLLSGSAISNLRDSCPNLLEDLLALDLALKHFQARICVAPLPWLSGQADPILPQLLRGLPLTPAAGNALPPTLSGALALAVFCAASGRPTGLLRASGQGQSGQGFARFLLLEPEAEAIQDPQTPDAPRLERIWVLEAHIDHLSGEELGRVFNVLLDKGALDVLWLPGLMKKNRPGGVLRVLCRPERLQDVQREFLRHTHTLGLRRELVERLILPRRAASLPGPAGPLQAKEYVLDGRSYIRPEYQALAEQAEALGETLPGLRFRKNEE